MMATPFGRDRGEIIAKSPRLVRSRLPLQRAHVGGPSSFRKTMAGGGDNLIERGGHKERLNYTGGRVNARLLGASGLPSGSRFLLADPRRYALVEHVKRQSSAIENFIVEGSHIVSSAKFFLRKLA